MTTSTKTAPIKTAPTKATLTKTAQVKATATKPQMIKQSWDVKRMQEEATKMVSHKIAARIRFLKKHSGKEIDEMEKVSAHVYADSLKDRGVKTPMDLVKYLAEYEVNMFGAGASIGGDDQCAVLINQKSAVWLATLQANDFSEEQIETMQDHFSGWMKHLGHGLGFKAHIEILDDGNGSKITFTQK
jgi:hypothetical protein